MPTLEHAHVKTMPFTINAHSHAAGLLDLRDALIRECHAIVRLSIAHGWERPPAMHDTGRYNHSEASPARWSGGSTLELIAHLSNSAGQRLSCHCAVNVTEARWFAGVNSSSLNHDVRDALRDSSHKETLTRKQLQAWHEISWRFIRVVPLDPISL